MPKYDVTVIGGGIVGAAIARELMRYQLNVVLLEKEAEVGFGTSKANSGIIHGGHHAAPDTLKGKLEWAGNQMWDSLCDELGFGFKRIGELTVALSQDQLPVLEKLMEHGRIKGIPGVELWERERIRREEPNLTSDIVAALYAPTTAVINPYEACFGLVDNAVDNGLHLKTNCTVQALSDEGDLWTVHTNQGNLHTQFILNAAGLFADEIAKMAGVGTFTILPRKGEEYMLDKRLCGLVKCVIFPCPTPVSKGTLIIPTFDGTIMVGPTADAVDDKESLSTTLSGGERIFESVKKLVPGISERDCIAEFAGLRASTVGEDFIIGPTAKKGFINVAGIQSPGLTAAPAIAVQIVDILRDEGLVLRINDDFEPSLTKPIHFAALSTEEQIALAVRDRRYAHLICRCEYVTEGEVVDAIRRGSSTLDGIKFRSRAGMGRCQGGFCTARCMELLANELNIPLTAVTKKGGNSWIVANRADRAESEGTTTSLTTDLTTDVEAVA